MAKVTINGEVFPWDSSRQPLSEALAIENTLHVKYADWQADMAAGSARAMAGFIWLVWRRNGRDIDFADIESGKVDVDMAACDLQPDDEEQAPPDPTGPLPGVSSMTGGSISGSSRNGSTSARGRSAASTSPSSKP